MSVWECCELFLCSVKVSKVNGGKSGLLMERKGGPEIVPPHPESKAKGTILDPLMCGDVSFCSKRESKWAISEEREN